MGPVLFRIDEIPEKRECQQILRHDTRITFMLRYCSCPLFTGVLNYNTNTVCIIVLCVAPYVRALPLADGTVFPSRKFIFFSSDGRVQDKRVLVYYLLS